MISINILVFYTVTIKIIRLLSDFSDIEIER
jgi:hypothetical protein